jgi:hypothetical protein
MVRFSAGYGVRDTGPKPTGPIFIFKEDDMLEVTQPAVEQISEYFKGKEVKPIRIFLNEGG